MGQGLRHYSALKGRPVGNRLATGANAHYQVLVSAAGASYRIAINVQSSDGSEVQFLVRQHFEHPITAHWERLPEGRTLLDRKPDSAAVDFIRSNIAQPWELIPLPMSAVGPDNDLNEKIDAYVQRAMADEEATIYAFGEAWGPEAGKADKFFGFLPGNGIHDIHMNQGNPPGKYAKDNGTYQDGALAFHFPRENLWAAVFMKFQSQAWHSDDGAAEPIPGVPNQPPLRDQPEHEVPDGLVRIMAAYVNDVRSPEHETVTLLNVSGQDVDLTGWSLKDKQKNAMPLSGSIKAGETLRVTVTAPMQLSNQGGIITLLDKRGVKVHGVSYTRAQAQQVGRTIPFQP